MSVMITGDEEENTLLERLLCGNCRKRTSISKEANKRENPKEDEKKGENGRISEERMERRVIKVGDVIT